MSENSLLNYIIHVYCCCKTAKSTVMQSKKSLPCRSTSWTPEPHNQVLFRWRKVWRSLKIIIFVKIKICGEFYILNFGATTFIIMAFSIKTLSIMADHCYPAECQYGECNVLFIIMLNVIMLSVAVLSLIMLIVVKNGWIEYSALEKNQ